MPDFESGAFNRSAISPCCVFNCLQARLRRVSITYDLNYVIDSSRVSVPREERVSRRLKHVGAEVVSAIESTGGKCPLCLPLCVMPCVSAARLIARLGYLGEIALQDRIDGQVIPALSIHSLLDFELYSVDGPGRAPG